MAKKNTPLIKDIKPRRNYWGNIYESDRLKEERIMPQNYDGVLYDRNDDNDSYYDSGSYD